MSHIFIKFCVVFAISFTSFIVITLPSYTSFFGLTVIPDSFFTGLYVISSVSAVASLGWQYMQSNPGALSFRGQKNEEVEVEGTLQEA